MMYEEDLTRRKGNDKKDEREIMFEGREMEIGRDHPCRPDEKKRTRASIICAKNPGRIICRKCLICVDRLSCMKFDQNISFPIT